MRVAVIVPEFPLATQTFTYIRVRALAEMGLSTVLFYRTHGDVDLCSSELLQSMFASGVATMILPSQSSVRSQFFELLLNLFRNITPVAFSFLLRSFKEGNSLRKSIGLLWQIYPLVFYNPDIIHIEKSYMAPGLYDALQFVDRPIIVSLRGADVDSKPFTSNQWKGWIIDSNQRNIIFHCVSEYIRSKAIEIGVLQHKCRMIYQGIYPEDYCVDDTDAIDNVEHRVGCIVVARLSSEKGVEHAVRGLRVLRDRGVDICLHIIGDGPERENLYRLVEDLEITEQVTFVGEQSNDWVRAYLLKHRADSIYLQPSVYEAFGQSILEAMAAGMPIVAARTGGIPELISHGETGLLHVPGAACDIADCVELLLDDQALATRISSNARARALNHFSARDEASHFARLFEGL